MIEPRLSNFQIKTIGDFNANKPAIKGVSLAEGNSSNKTVNIDSTNITSSLYAKKIDIEPTATSKPDSSSFDWVNQGAQEVAKRYFDEDLSKAPDKVGDVNLDNSKSRLGAALDLGAAPFANDSNTIAANYGFSTVSASSSAPESVLENYLKVDDKEEDKEDDLSESIDKMARDFKESENLELRQKVDILIENSEKDNPDLKDSLKPEGQTEHHPDLKDSLKPEGQTEHHPDLKDSLKPEGQTEHHPDLKDSTKPELHTENQPDLKDSTKPGNQIENEVKNEKAPPVVENKEKNDDENLISNE